MDAKSEADRLIGIDVSKARVDAHVQPDGTAFLLHDRYRGLGRAGQAGAQVRRRHWPVGQNRCDQSLSSGRPTAGPWAAVIAHFAQAVRPAARPLPDGDCEVRVHIRASLPSELPSDIGGCRPPSPTSSRSLSFRFSGKGAISNPL
jgi:hypothetical protein